MVPKWYNHQNDVGQQNSNVVFVFLPFPISISPKSAVLINNQYGWWWGKDQKQRKCPNTAYNAFWGIFSFTHINTRAMLWKCTKNGIWWQVYFSFLKVYFDILLLTWLQWYTFTINQEYKGSGIRMVTAFARYVYFFSYLFGEKSISYRIGSFSLWK